MQISPNTHRTERKNPKVLKWKASRIPTWHRFSSVCDRAVLDQHQFSSNAIEWWHCLMSIMHVRCPIENKKQNIGEKSKFNYCNTVIEIIKWREYELKKVIMTYIWTSLTIPNKDLTRSTSISDQLKQDLTTSASRSN